MNAVCFKFVELFVMEAKFCYIFEGFQPQEDGASPAYVNIAGKCFSLVERTLAVESKNDGRFQKIFRNITSNITKNNQII